ncbi:MAG: regulatory iron-sulfur-containing complex subunit RicT [Bacteroidales bacterium]|nr:regulatory iron-sulfur-containing complex subunit RicT [Bacteroidales bacterium]MDD3105734.1 regulatory iron-sulfur-containing complex subunit RicT [Bacteroidales bacterium]MDD3550135.1 regulatory iron-sulfur-containing complex subunit RicT [Bacteroidales bacterium]MDD4500107.1 regulatory iron-sulfur-containing complex subunit RicT [Bacteroidales bacterium]
MEENNIKHDCSRGCVVERTPMGDLQCTMNYSTCKLATYNWLEGLDLQQFNDIFEIRFKNTHKGFYRNASDTTLKVGDIVAVEAATGHDIGLVSLAGPLVLKQMKRHKLNPQTYEFRKIYRKAKLLDLEKWQEAIAREHHVLMRSRQIAAAEGLQMKIGDVEFQGDGTKAIFYYIADERVDFRKLIKLFASEFCIRIEMRQFGARQEAGLIGGLGVCGQELCCSRWMADFNSVTTQSARIQDLSLNPQKLAGQCSKLKCCIDYETPVYMDALKDIPEVTQPIETTDGPVYLVKTDVLKGTMWFSRDPHSMSDMQPVAAKKVREMLAANKQGIKVASLYEKPRNNGEQNGFKSAAGEESITRFDKKQKNKRRKNYRRKNGPKQS